MIINVDSARLKAFLASCEDAEDLGGGEYTVDLYDVEKPISLDILIDKKGVDILAALEMLYDEEQDGWYLGEKIKDTALLEKLIGEALAE